MTIASAAPNFRVQMSTLSGEIPESEGRIVQVHEASSTRFRVTRDNGFTEQYDGSFSYNGGGVSGTINTYTLSRNGAVLLTITGANAPIDQGQITPAVAFFAGDDRLEGSDLDDQLVAFNGNDAVIGKAGNDFLIGGPGSDTLAGGAGADSLVGGLGADSFAFDLTALSDGAAGILDRVMDFERGVDLIDVSLITSAAQAAGSLVRVAADAAGGFATLQVDADGTGAASGWTSIARLDGVRQGDNLSVLLAGGLATIAVAGNVNLPSVVAAGPVNAVRGQLLPATSLFSASDPDGDALVQFKLYDGNPDPASGSFVVDGVAQPAGQFLTLSAAELAQTSFQAGFGAGDTVWVAVFDGTQWSAGQSFAVNPVNAGTLGTDGLDVLRGGPGLTLCTALAATISSSAKPETILSSGTPGSITSMGARGTISSTAATAPTACSEAAVATTCSGAPATTRCSAEPVTTRWWAEPATTRCPAATATTSYPDRSAPTRWLGAPASTACSDEQAMTASTAAMAATAWRAAPEWMDFGAGPAAIASSSTQAPVISTSSSTASSGRVPATASSFEAPASATSPR